MFSSSVVEYFLFCQHVYLNNKYPKECCWQKEGGNANYLQGTDEWRNSPSYFPNPMIKNDVVEQSHRE